MFIEVALELSVSLLIDKFNGINFLYISYFLPIPNLNSSLSCTSLEGIDVIHLQTNSCKLMNKSLHIRHGCQLALYDTAVDSWTVTD